MGACLGSSVASEVSEDNTLDGESSLGDCEGEWYLDVARQVASTTHRVRVSDHETIYYPPPIAFCACPAPRRRRPRRRFRSCTKGEYSPRFSSET